MIRSRNETQDFPQPFAAARRHAWRRELRSLIRPRLISNLLALVALISIGFV